MKVSSFFKLLLMTSLLLGFSSCSEDETPANTVITVQPEPVEEEEEDDPVEVVVEESFSSMSDFSDHFNNKEFNTDVSTGDFITYTVYETTSETNDLADGDNFWGNFFDFEVSKINSDYYSETKIVSEITSSTVNYNSEYSGDDSPSNGTGSNSKSGMITELFSGNLCSTIMEEEDDSLGTIYTYSLCDLNYYGQAYKKRTYQIAVDKPLWLNPISESIEDYSNGGQYADQYIKTYQYSSEE